MTTLKAHFDGRVLVPEQPVDLPQDCLLEIVVRPLDAVPDGTDTPAPLAGLVELANQFPANPDLPTDGAARHDHYLYDAA